MNNTLFTKFGNARINQYGYYQISSSKEGNGGKLLHRLIVEDYYNISLLPWADIHHIDNDKLNNNPDNLVILHKSAHRSLHSKGENNSMYGKSVSDKTKDKIKKSKTIKHARIMKKNVQSKPYYSIRKDGKYIKSSRYLIKLLEWFVKEHPKEILQLNRVF